MRACVLAKTNPPAKQSPFRWHNLIRPPLHGGAVALPSLLATLPTRQLPRVFSTRLVTYASSLHGFVR